MKKSNRILAGSVLVVLVTFLVFLIMVRISLNDHLPPDSDPSGKSEKSYRMMHTRGVTSLSLKGNWDVEIVGSDDEKMTVTGPGDLLETLWIKQQNNLIELHMEKRQHDNRRLHLKMSMPEIHLLQTRGIAEASVSGFDLETLIIDSEGITSVKGTDGRTRQLTLTGKGVSNLDFEQFPAHDVSIACKGTAKIDLTMTGGELTGKMEGAGTVEYQGEISRESIRLKGACKIIRQ